MGEWLRECKSGCRKSSRGIGKHQKAQPVLKERIKLKKVAAAGKSCEQGYVLGLSG